MEDTPKYCKKQKHYLLHSINALYLEILPGSVGGGRENREGQWEDVWEAPAFISIMRE